MPLLPISHHKQHQQAECLAACALMVLNHLQKSVTYNDLLKLLKINYAGAPFRNLYYLEKLGVKVNVGQGNLNILRSCLTKKIPPIVFVATHELSYWNESTNHAVVIVGLDEDTIYINDPNFEDAPQTTSISEFDLAWLAMDEFFAVIEVE